MPAFRNYSDVDLWHIPLKQKHEEEEAIFNSNESLFDNMEEVLRHTCKGFCKQEEKPVQERGFRGRLSPDALELQKLFANFDYNQKQSTSNHFKENFF